jgi:5'-nucleotidase
VIVLVTNDDGYDAPGLAVLADIARDLFGPEVYVVAPDVERSGSGHSITLRQRVSVSRRAERGWALGGTPADCVRVGVNALLPAPPQLVLSGVNRGFNLGTDVYYSGTVSAAIEACMGGLPAVAVSAEDPGDRQTPREPVEAFLPDILRAVVAHGLPRRTLLNVNIPRRPPRGLRVTRLGVRQYTDRFELRHDASGAPFFWLSGGPTDGPDGSGTDVTAAAEGYVTLTPLLLELTHHDFVPVLRSWEIGRRPPRDAAAVAAAPDGPP